MRPRRARTRPPTARRPRCSIIIPVFNRHGPHATMRRDPPRRASGETDSEIIVVDDASTDGTPSCWPATGTRSASSRTRRTPGSRPPATTGAAAATRRLPGLPEQRHDRRCRAGSTRWCVRGPRSRRPQSSAASCCSPTTPSSTRASSISQDLNPRHIYAGFPADHPAVNKSRRFQIVTAGCALFRRDAVRGGRRVRHRRSSTASRTSTSACGSGSSGTRCTTATERALPPRDGDEGLHPVRQRNHLLYRAAGRTRCSPTRPADYLEDGLLNSPLGSDA